MLSFPCPYLQTEVEITAERIRHIAQQHPELPSDHLDRMAATLFDPDEVRTDQRFPRTRLFSRWFDDLLKGKILVVAVVADEPIATSPSQSRYWVVTSYPARRITQGVIEWQRP